MQKDAVREYAVLASQSGSVPAHLALAETADTETEELFHIFAAKKLLGQAFEDDLQ